MSARARAASLAAVAVGVGVMAIVAIAGLGWSAPAPEPAPAPAPAPVDAGAPEPDAALDDQLAALASAPPTFDPAQPRPTGFDHRIHDRNLIVSGKEALACTRCHALAQGRVIGRPGHDACFGACHGAAPRKVAKIVVAGDQVRVCSACHAGAVLAARAAGKPGALVVPYPPYTIDRDFGLTLSHKAHAAAATCESCHVSPSAPAPAPAPAAKKVAAPHARCIGCHLAPATAAVPPMTACAACHADAYGPASGPRMTSHPLALTGFDHARHRARASAATCTTCHAAIAAADGTTLDAPTTASCQAGGCHDGKIAFATTGACTRCHTRAPTATWRSPRPDARFSHAAHVPRIGDVACATCHALDRRGEATGPGHAACASCHADDFASATPRICGGCHVAAEPWRALTADREPPAETEFGARLSHAGHTADCASCHRLRSASREMRPPLGHVACSAGACHAAKAGPAPHLGDCAACHVLGLVPDRTRDRLAAAWSVRARFRHAGHDHDASGAPLACTACHGGVGAATSLAEVPAPRKPACQPCHDGTIAFKLTGTDCARCHGVR